MSPTKKNSIGLSTTIVSSIRKLSLSLLLLGCLTSPSWGKTKEVEIIGKPVVNEDRVTVRVKVKDELEKPVMGLNYTDFNLKIDGKEVTLNNKDWKSPEETIPPPAWIIVLLDLSGSMKQRDSGGETKLEGAVKAIRRFTQLSAKRGGNTQIAIVPFGESGAGCNQGYRVNQKTLDKFFSAGDFKLQNYLDYLSGLTPCAATNLYDPLEEAVRFLDNKQDTRFHLPEESTAPDPRLSVVLLSDGYHSKPNEEQDFERLIRILKSQSEIVVHTLGYGLTPEELAKKYKVGKGVTRADIEAGKIPAEEFVDREKLAEIARTTGGIAEFSGNARDIAEALQVFLNSLLGEYEISYTHPNAERGSKHEVSVAANSVSSEPKPYIITVFGRSLSRPIRFSLTLFTLLLLGLGGILPFQIWAKKLKYEGMDD